MTDIRKGKIYLLNFIVFLSDGQDRKKVLWFSDWMKHELESRLLGEISITSDTHHPYGRKQKETKEPLDESKRGE